MGLETSQGAFLFHDGVAHDENPPGRGSGRYAWGSGKNPFQHSAEYSYMNGSTSQEFLDFVKKLRTGYTDENGNYQEGLSNKDIALNLGFLKVDEHTHQPVDPPKGDAQLLQRRLEYLNEEARNRNRQKVMTIMDDHPEYMDEDGNWSATKIAKALGMNASQESTVRGWIASIDEEQNFKIANTADAISEALDEYGLLTIGLGSAELMGVTQTKFDAAIQKMVDEDGYNVYNLKIPQPNDPLKYTTIKTLAPPDMTYNEAYQNRDKMRPIVGFESEDDGLEFNTYGLRTPTSVDSSRVNIVYADDIREDGTKGIDRDGLIELRPGLDELSIGDKVCAQVRIAVDGTHYLKGMAVYNPDLPEGVDIQFNTNKTHDVPALGPDKNHSVLKPLKDDPQNPFGSMLKTEDGEVIGQKDYIDPNTGEKKLSPINICREEGDWEDWSKSLPSQMWSKQTTELAKRQLSWSVDEKKAEFDDIMSLSNPEIRKALLNEFAEKCDTAAVDLKGSAMPRQKTCVLLPCPTLKPNEVYAPMYEDGEEVITIRYPHGGTFEIGHAYVNNKNPEGQKIIGKMSTDVIGIPKNIADQMSGADFDGDTATVIPLRGQEKLINYKPQLEGLKNFSTDQYAKTDDQVKTGPRKKGGDGFNTQKEMGVITNLIMDMTLQGATDSDLERAVRHSMVVIDAEKHNLDHKASYKDNNIEELKMKYQPKPDATTGKKYGGAGTLITRAKSETHPLHQREIYSYKDMTPEERERYDRGERIYRDSGKTKPKYDRKTGTWVQVEATGNSTRMADTNDAYTLITGEGHPMERIAADYANTMKSMANQARKAARETKTTKVNQSAKQAYAKEIAELKADLARAKTNKPREQAAQAVSHGTVAQLLREHPDWKEDKDKVKKMRNQTLSACRKQAGANKKNVYVRIDERKLEAMNSGALSSSMITAIVNNCDKDKFKKLALPRNGNTLSSADQMKIRHLVDASKGSKNGYTIEEIAKIVGCSPTTVKKYS